MFESTIEEYAKREPPGTDAWNPLFSDLEFWHRARLFSCMKEGLQLLNVDPRFLRVLDVGCGVGRSTRLLVEFGVRPENIVGVDIRESAIDLARELNPAIDYLCLQPESVWPHIGEFDLCMQCTVFGSIKGLKARAYLANKMQAAIHNSGHILWWDGIRANDFAGRDELDALSLFPKMRAELVRYLPLRPTLVEAHEGQHGIGKRVIRFLQPLSPVKNTHCFALFGPQGSRKNWLSPR